MAYRQHPATGDPIYAHPPPQVRPFVFDSSTCYVKPKLTTLSCVQAPSIPEVPTAINTLLEQTKRLEDSIRRWGLLEVTETEVSDVFVDVGNAFHEMLAAFSVYAIDMGYVEHFLRRFLRLIIYLTQTVAKSRIS